MRDACIRSVEAAIGRPITQAEARNIETRVRRAMLQGARLDPASWRALSPADRLQEGGKLAGQELVAEVAKAKQRLGLTVLAKQNLEGYLNDRVADGANIDKLGALIRRLVGKNDGRNEVTPVAQEAKGIFANAMREMESAVEALRPGIWAVMPWANRRLQNAFYDALHGITKDVPPEIIAAAKSFHEVAEALLERWNAAGGVTGKLENWGLPHTWSDRIALKRGQDAFVNDFYRFVDRNKYVNEDGTLMTDDQMRAWLGEAWKTIATDGASKEKPSPYPGGSIKANRRRHHREVHLKPEFAREALNRWSDRSALDSIVGHMRQMGRDVALIEAFGPNADHMFAHVLDNAVYETANNLPHRAPMARVANVWAKSYYDFLAGNRSPPASRRAADIMASWRALEVAFRLGGASVTAAVTDPVFLHMNAHYNRLDHFKVFANQLAALSPKSRRFARRMGLMTETIIAHADRFATDEVIGREITGRIASETLRLSGLQFVTEMRRLGFSITMLDSIGHLTRRYQDVAKLRADDYRILASKGIDQATWDIWRAAKLDTWGANATLLTPDAIMQVPGHTEERLRQAVTKLLSIVNEEQDIAVIQPDVRERVQFGAQLQAGTTVGEITRSLAMIKSFPWAVITRHWERALAQPGFNRWVAIAALIGLTTTAGIFRNWVFDLIGGRDLRNINPLSDDEKQRSTGVRNLLAGYFAGGGAGLYGDFLFAEVRDSSGSGFAETLGGPIAQRVGEVQRLTMGNLAQAAAGEETNAGTEVIKALRGATPNTWYTRAVLDRYVYNHWMEMADPGYLDRMRSRQERVYGSEFWWEPGEEAPHRAPNLASAVGEQ